MDLMKQKRNQMASDPLYEGWYQAYLDNGNSRLESTLKVITDTTGDNVNAVGMLWILITWNINGMQEYLTARDQMLEMERQSGSGLGAEINVQIMQQ